MSPRREDKNTCLQPRLPSKLKCASPNDNFTGKVALDKSRAWTAAGLNRKTARTIQTDLLPVRPRTKSWWISASLLLPHGRSRCHVESDLLGVPSHGVCTLPMLVCALKEGRANANPQIRITREILERWGSLKGKGAKSEPDVARTTLHPRKKDQ